MALKKTIRLAILLTLSTSLSFGQTDLDYQLYSQVLNNFINEGLRYNEQTSQVVVINKYIPDENIASAYGEDFLGDDEHSIRMVLHYDTMKIRLFNDAKVKDVLKQLERDFFETPSLDENKFVLTTTVSAITNREFKSYFKKGFDRRTDKGWKKFYKKHPGSHGVFEFSKIVYADYYACFYVGRHSGGLSGSGDIVIAKRRNGEWDIITSVNIWMS
ncbi:MAG: hypothetical protein QM762_18030 [Chryseolinea sp.]